MLRKKQKLPCVLCQGCQVNRYTWAKRHTILWVQPRVSAGTMRNERGCTLKRDMLNCFHSPLYASPFLLILSISYIQELAFFNCFFKANIINIEGEWYFIKREGWFIWWDFCITSNSVLRISTSIFYNVVLKLIVICLTLKLNSWIKK